MKTVYLQFWEESGRDWGVRPDGCSLHLSIDEQKKFVESIYAGRDPDNVPDEYERILGEPIEAEVSDSLYEELISEGSLRIMQHSFMNLKNMEEIKILTTDEFA